MGMVISPVTLEGRQVRLEPLSMKHLDTLCELGLEEELWRFSQSIVRTPEEMRAYIESALQSQKEGAVVPFATVHCASGAAVGSTRYGSIDPAHRKLEIGWTWIGRPFQRTSVNTEAKYLMLRHAFEELGCVRVEFKIDSRNERSRTALLRIGAKEEGTLRNHMITRNGEHRHSIYFSVISAEWQGVKARLEEKLERGRE